ncbi:Protein of unknown function [Rhodoferax sp. OV413]|uniref:DUF2730 family protein n=1 Tax=Rhodoferax sp. OV413 TaxID=1855285 RepID=UPI000885BEBA|nr:DUF2730 family protein [Rhodoferax sp. OV413]SDO76802.1 Protein of unknown function [Rhodoferax sp. OV413]
MPDLNYQAMGFYMAAAQWIAMGLMGVWVYLRTKDDDNAKALTKLHGELTVFISESTKANENQNTRLSVLEEVVKHVPTDEEIGKISSQVSNLDARVDGLSEMLKRIEHQTSIIQTHLMSNK